jgi:protein gp37
MSSSSAIEWTDATWNPVTGCDRVSPGCAHCYALELAPRLRAMGVKRYVDARDGGRSSGPAFGVTLHPDVLEQPLRWRRPRRVFVNSMSDLFHDEVPSYFIDRVFEVMRRCPQHTFQVLTKRPQRMRDYALERSEPAACVHAPWWPLPNVWLGVSIENRRFVHRADLLRETPAAVRFISAEPLLGPLVPCGIGCYCFPDVERTLRPWRDGYDGPALALGGIDWLIVGGESGPRHRPIDPQWVRDLRDASLHAGTAFFLKQWGGRTPKAGGRELDGRTWDEMPAAAASAGAVPRGQEALATP